MVASLMTDFAGLFTSDFLTVHESKQVNLRSVGRGLDIIPFMKQISDNQFIFCYRCRRTFINTKTSFQKPLTNTELIRLGMKMYLQKVSTSNLIFFILHILLPFKQEKKL